MPICHFVEDLHINNICPHLPLQANKQKVGGGGFFAFRNSMPQPNTKIFYNGHRNAKRSLPKAFRIWNGRKLSKHSIVIYSQIEIKIQCSQFLVTTSHHITICGDDFHNQHNFVLCFSLSSECFLTFDGSVAHWKQLVCTAWPKSPGFSWPPSPPLETSSCLMDLQAVQEIRLAKVTPLACYMGLQWGL